MLNMLEYARIFAYRTDMNLIGRDGRTDGRDGRTHAQTTLTTNIFFIKEDPNRFTTIVLYGLRIQEQGLDRKLQDLYWQD
jgi:hypothetical protein